MGAKRHSRNWVDIIKIYFPSDSSDQESVRFSQFDNILKTKQLSEFSVNLFSLKGPHLKKER